jgi:hypothetical protein
MGPPTETMSLPMRASGAIEVIEDDDIDWRDLV